ncbi:alpha/beta hydrolase family protein [Paraburkholderia acidiphila]|uniref:Alpha/beta hydrolase n=1 Tax=Paraburkholderia acidiphila TaxID=2571747 RepID=A0A7Z2GBI7_9BURK|nr:alpha/beta hydrolase [Paraburkholderia acidiphila]QGZ58651.1 alpha/beta hydrolase [Paraburkholderia acidiphila]
MSGRIASRWRRVSPLTYLLAFVLAASSLLAHAQSAPRVVDIPTRPGVTQRFLFIAPAAPKAVAMLYAGGHGGLQLDSQGNFGWGANNFLVRTRMLFVNDGVAVAVIDAPGDRQSPPYLDGFRLTPEHAEDARAVIAWLRAQLQVPVWLVGTSRGTQSVAAIAIALANSANTGASPGAGPDGIVLTSTILRENRGGDPVTSMNLAALKIPVLVVHNKDDACKLCPVSDTDTLVQKLTQSPRTKLMLVSGGTSRGDPCGALAYHGYNGIESDVVHDITSWMLAP